MRVDGKEVGGPVLYAAVDDTVGAWVGREQTERGTGELVLAQLPVRAPACERGLYDDGDYPFIFDRLFPVEQASLIDGIEADENQLYIFEPDPNSIFNEVLPMFVQSTMQEITIENRASEQAARVMAMQTANDNAQKLRDELQLEYNKLRQQSITAELLDLLGGQVER